MPIVINNNRIARNTLFLYLRMGLVLVVSLFTTRVLLQALGIIDYGINNVVSGFVSMFAFLNTSMSNGVQRYYNFAIGRENEYSVQDVYNTSFLIQLILALGLVVILETVGIWYINAKMVIPSERLLAAQWIFQFSILSLILMVLQIPYSAAIMAYERMDYFAYLSMFDVFAKLGIAYAVKYTGYDKLILYGSLNLFISFICFFLYYIYARRYFSELKLDYRIRKHLFRLMLSFSGWNVFGAFAYMIKSQGLNVLLNFFGGTIVNAARGVSNMVMNAIQGFQANIVIAFRPQLIQSYAEGNYDRVMNLFYALSKLSFVLLAVLSIPIIIEVKYILYLWLGENIPDYTIPFTVLTLVNMVISSLNTPVSQIVHATGEMKRYQLGTSIVICSILPLSWLCLKIGYSPVIVYWISIFVTVLNQVVCNLLLKKIFSYSIKEYIVKVILPCISFVLIVPIIPFAVSLLMPSSFMRLIFIVLLSGMIGLVVLYLFVLDKTERYMLLNFLKKIVNASHKTN